MTNILAPSVSTSHLPKEAQELINKPDKLFRIINSEKAPLAISIPSQALDEARTFEKSLNSLIHSYKLFFAYKATNSLAIIKKLKGSSGLDIASINELKGALHCGYSTADIIATGPKTDEFLCELASHDDITIIVDSYEELERLSRIKKDAKQDILIRLTRSVISQPSVKKLSRFGVDSEGLARCTDLLGVSTNLCLKGLAFHLDTQSVIEKAYAIKTAVDMLVGLQAEGFQWATILDIGGGFGKTNGLSKSQYETLKLDQLKLQNNEAADIEYWDNIYPTNIANEISYPVGSDRLDEILSSTIDDCVVAEYINESLVELWIEPGAAIAEPAGLFVARVIELKKMDNNLMAVVDARRNQLEFGPCENMADPIIIKSQPNSDDKTDDGFYILGHLCMETDFISYKKIYLEYLPKAGDLLVWRGTGAYRNYFNESLAIGHQSAARYELVEGELVKEYDI